MRTGTVTLYLLAIGVWCAPAQDMSFLHEALSPKCVELQGAIHDHVSNGRLAEAEAVMSQALTGEDKDLQPSCEPWILINLTSVVALSGRIAEAEDLAHRTLNMMDKIYSRSDPIRLQTLQILGSIQYADARYAKFRETTHAMKSLRITLPRQRALVCGASAVLAQQEGRYGEAEQHYLDALAGWREAGRGQSADAAAVQRGLCELQLDQGRLSDAEKCFGTALTTLHSAPDSVPLDRIQMLNAQAVLYVRQRNWQSAGENLRSAIAIAEGEAHLDPPLLKRVLDNYVYVLRKLHRGKEASAIQARVAKMPHPGPANALVDVSELVAAPRRMK